MKIKNIAAICKKNKYAVIYERNTESGGVVQYIGDGNAADPAPFPSMVVIYNGERVKNE